MRKFLALFLAFALVLALGGCGGSTAGSTPPSESSSLSESESSSPASSSEPETASSSAALEKTGKTLRVAALKGPTAMGMVKLMEEAENGNTANDYEFTLAGSPDEIVGSIVTGEFDIAAVPTNLAATLYNKTQGKVRLMALNTLGVLYVIEAGDSVRSVEDLAGRTVYSTGKGSTPEFAFDYVLEKNGVKDQVTVEYKSEHAELAALLSQGQAELALLPQPFVTTAMAQNPGLRVALDLTEEWDKAAQGASQLTMGCVIAQKSFLEENAAAAAAFLAEYEASVEFVTDPANLDEAAALIVSQGILASEAVAKTALPQCGITFLAGEEMKKTASGFLQVLYDADPQSVGGALPDDDLYHVP